MTTVASEQMTDHLCSLVALLREERGHDYKQSASWDQLKYKIAKTCIGMANTRYGGVIIIGVKQEADDIFTPTGMSEVEAQTYSEDDIRTFVNTYADPSLNLNLVRFKCDEQLFLAIEVPEFTDIPVICSRDGRDLTAGTVYIRPMGKAETRPPRDAYELRELLNLSTQKSTRRFIEEMRAVGVLAPTSLDPAPTDSDRFDQQLGSLLEKD